MVTAGEDIRPRLVYTTAYASPTVVGYHQFHAVRYAIESTVAASAPAGDREVGVIWHTQGSGKSLLMAFYAGQLVKHPVLENPMVVVLTDL